MAVEYQVKYTPGFDPTIVNVSQNDVGRQFDLKIIDETGAAQQIPSGSTVKFVGMKPSGLGFTVNCTFTNSVVHVTTTDIMTDEHGLIPAEVQITNGNTVIGTANVNLRVEKNPHPEGTIDDNLIRIIPTFEVIYQRLDILESSMYTAENNISNLQTRVGIVEVKADDAYDIGSQAATMASAYAVEIGGIKRGYDGAVYQTAGDAVRAQAFRGTDTTLSVSGKAADAKVTGDEISGLKSDLNVIYEDVVIDDSPLAVYQTSNSWKLVDTGFCVSDSTYKMVKYAVTAGSLISVISDHKYQFQSIATVNTSGNNNRIGATHGVYSGFVTVPTGANYIVFSTPKENGEAACFGTYSVKNAVSEIESVINDIYVTPLNLVDAINARASWWVNNDTGIPVESTDALYAITDYIDIKPSTQYANARVVRLWFYDENKNYISTSAGNNTASGGLITTPTNARYVIVGFNKSYYVNDVIMTADTTIPVVYSEYFTPHVKVDTYVSPFDKSAVINFVGLPISGYYKGLGNTYNEEFNRDTQADEIITAFDALISNYGQNYMSKTDLGVSSDGVNHLYEYTLQPKVTSTPTADVSKKYPVVLVLSAQHGFEKSSVYGLYYFVRDLLTKWSNSPLLDYIRHHITLKIIPIANPYGFNHVQYNNANGVNLNRNYDTSGFPANPSAQVGDSDYGGATPFDQPETAIVRDWVEDNLDAFMFIDFHTNGQSSVSSYDRINWIAPPLAKDDYYAKLWKAGTYHIANITAHFTNDYSLDLGSDMCGYMTGTAKGESTVPTADVWVTNQGIVGLTFEGFNGFVGETAFSADEQKANSELIGNWIVTVLNTFAMT